MTAHRKIAELLPTPAIAFAYTPNPGHVAGKDGCRDWLRYLQGAMMRPLALILLAASGLSGATCTLTANAVGLSSAVWSGCSPTSSDTIDLSAGRSLTLLSGDSLHVARYIAGAAGSIVLQAGATLRIDSGSPTNTAIAYSQSGSTNYIIDGTGASVWVNGLITTAVDFAQRRTIRCVSCTGFGWDRAGGATLGQNPAAVKYGTFSLVLTSTPLYRWGDASNPVIYGGWNASNQTVWSFTDVTCWHCGGFRAFSNSTGVTLTRVRFRDSVSGFNWLPSNGGLSGDAGSAFRCRGCVFDREVNANGSGSQQSTHPLDLTEVLSESTGATVRTLAASVPYTNATDIAIRKMGIYTGMSMSSFLLFETGDAGNPEGIIYNHPSSPGIFAKGLIAYEGGTFIDAGTGLFHNTAQTFSATGMLFVGGLYNDDFYTTATAIQPNASNGGLAAIERNTFNVSRAFGYGHGAALTNPARIAAMRNNLMLASRTAADNWWSYDIDLHGSNSSCGSYTQQDGSLSSIGNNISAYGVGGIAPGACNTNSANGYGGRWSATPPGAADRVIDPRVVRAATPWEFPTAYLGRAGSRGRWSSSAVSYQTGETVVVSHATVAGGAAILYRALRPHTSTALNQPGLKSLRIGSGITSWSTSGGTATVVFSGAHGLATGDPLSVYYAAGQGVSGEVTVSVTNATTVTFPAPGATGSPSGTSRIALWRTLWEFGVYEEIRNGIMAGSRFRDLDINDGTCIPSSPCNIIAAVNNWTRRQYVPTNPAVWSAGTDGGYVGAVDPAPLRRAAGALSVQ